MLGFRWDHKLQKWVVFLKSTGKIVSKHETEKEAKRELSRLRSTGEEEILNKRRYH